MTRQISLTQEKFAIVDDDMYDYLMQWKWCTYKMGNNFYAARKDKGTLFRKSILMHRFIMNTPNGMEADHIDLDGLNNTRTNLRNCTHAQNNQNKKKQSNNSSGYKGIVWDKERKKWKAQISVNGKHVLIGRFSNIEDAVKAYDEIAKQYHGEFANTNF